MTDNTQPEAREFTMSQYASKDDMIGAMRKRIAELESELEAVGAGGVQALSAAPAIKPLVWSDESGPTEKIRYNHITAETALGQFSVEWKGWKEEDWPCVYLNGDHIGVASNLGGAKQLAERHIRELVANLLAASPTPPALSAAPAEQQAAPKAAPGVGNSGFDHQTAADFLSGKTVSDEAVRKFVAESRWAHNERAALSATLLAMHGVLTSREAEIALLKKALLEAEAAPQQEAQEPVAWQSRTRPVWGDNTRPWSPWEPCTKAQADDYWKAPLLHDWAYEARALYTAPQPAPAPLSDDTKRLNWLLWKLPGDALRYVVGELSDTSSGAEFRAAIDAALAAQKGKV